MAPSEHWTRSSWTRHTYHELSAENKLITIDIPERKRTPFLRLPDELLIMILRLATLLKAAEICQQCEPQHNPPTIRALSLTCRLFNHIVSPLVYHSMRLEYPPSAKAVKRLRYLMRKKRSSSLQFCRVLTIHLQGYYGNWNKTIAQYAMGDDFVSQLQRVRCLEIKGGNTISGFEYPWTFIQHAVQNMREIEHLTIGRRAGVNLNMFMERIDPPSSLRKLDLHEVSDTYNQPSVPRQTKKRRTASFTSLSLPHCAGNLDDLRELFNWPKTLFHLDLPVFYYCNTSFEVSALHSMVLIHKDTLKTLTVGYFSFPDKRCLFNVSDFPNLETLRLSRAQMETKLEFSATHADLLFGPNLERFEWEFPNWSGEFGKREERWLGEFAREANSRKAKLKVIEIKAPPDFNLRRASGGYPWDRLDRLRDEFESYGMRLEYGTPSMEKSVWMKRSLKMYF